MVRDTETEAGLGGGVRGEGQRRGEVQRKMLGEGVWDVRHGQDFGVSLLERWGLRSPGPRKFREREPKSLHLQCASGC